MVRSEILPSSGKGFGPGGKDAREALGFRNQMKRMGRRLARASRTEEEVMGGQERRKGGE